MVLLLHVGLMVFRQLLFEGHLLRFHVPSPIHPRGARQSPRSLPPTKVPCFHTGATETMVSSYIYQSWTFPVKHVVVLPVMAIHSSSACHRLVDSDSCSTRLHVRTNAFTDREVLSESTRPRGPENNGAPVHSGLREHSVPLTGACLSPKALAPCKGQGQHQRSEAHGKQHLETQ